ncbi:MAG: sirohydrochlorin cobaltochelatase [Candidatus Endobugula sp.]|jgi:sirohydrochlorin cobaltochelatase
MTPSNPRGNTVLIIMAHGSRKPEANHEFLQLTQTIAQQDHGFIAVTPCFLELTTPTLFDAIAEAVAEGHTQFDIYPLFFNQGNHVTKDIPRQITQLQEQYPLCFFNRLEYFGLYQQLGDQVLAHIGQQRG